MELKRISGIIGGVVIVVGVITGFILIAIFSTSGCDFGCGGENQTICENATTTTTTTIPPPEEFL